MFASIFASHSPLIRDYPGAPPTPPAPPAPMPSPQPPVAEPIAFSVVTRASLFGIVGTPISSTTLATVTCADSSMTIAVSEPVPGLTFSYAGNVLSVAGTPTGPTKLHRVVVSYIASDGSNSVRGSTSHEITIVSASEVLTIGSMVNFSGRVGRPFSLTLASPSTNYAVDVTALASSQVPGCSASLAWTKGASSGSGVLTFSGIPQEAGNYTLTINYYAFGSVLLGTSIHAVEISPAYAAPPPAPAPSPAPSPPAPSAPPAPTPAPAPGAGPDPTLTGVRVLMRFDQLTGLSYDPAVGPPYMNVEERNGYAFTMRNVTASTDGGALGFGPVPGRSGIYRAAAVLSGSGSDIGGEVPGLAGAATGLSAECMVNIGVSAWDALLAPGLDARFCPVVSYSTPTGQVLWALGFYAYAFTFLDGSAPTRFIRPALYHYSAGMLIDQTGASAGSGTRTRPGRFIHLAGNLRVTTSEWFESYAWWDGQQGEGTQVHLSVPAPAGPASAVLRIGGTCPAFVFRATAKQPMVNIVPFTGAVDELRIKTPGQYDSLLPGDGGFAQPITAAQRVIPWPNY